MRRSRSNTMKQETCPLKRKILFLFSITAMLCLCLPVFAESGDPATVDIGWQHRQIERNENEEGADSFKIKVSDGKNTVIFQLNDTPPAKSLYEMLPMDVSVENYGDNEKIFYPEQKIDTTGGLEGQGQAGGLALFSPWGNVVMYLTPFGSYPGLYVLGEAIEGSKLIRHFNGNVHVEAFTTD